MDGEVRMLIRYHTVKYGYYSTVKCGISTVITAIDTVKYGQVRHYIRQCRFQKCPTTVLKRSTFSINTEATLIIRFIYKR